MASAHATTNGSYGGQEQYNTAAAGAQHTENGNSANKSGDAEASKDEVGWYFVERYYTTLSDKPDQLHLFYNKKSQFVCGKEATPEPVLVGRNAIQEKIRELEYQGSKVRVSNVDSQQADGESIVVQVIGEIFNNKSKAIKKFVQTFVLAKQVQGWFVLNDILRYLNDEPEEEEEVPAVEQAAPAAVEEPVAEVEAPKAEEPIEAPKAAKLDVDEVDKELESVLVSESAAEVPVTNGNGVTAEVDKAEDAPVAATKPEVSLTPEVAEKETEEEVTKKQEKPKEPTATPAVAASPPKAKPAAPVQPAAPPKPMTWATRAAAAAGPVKPAAPVVPVTTTVNSPAKKAPTPAAPAAPIDPAATVPAPQPAQPEKEPGWQAVGGDQKRTRPQSGPAPVVKDDTLGYVRNVTEKVNVDELKAALGKFGELVYFDVNRSKNCAFVEFANAAGQSAAQAANPHILSGEHIMVEPRRPKTNAYGGNGYNGNNRGAMNNRGRGNFDQGRPGSQGGGRGGFAPRGRGAPAAPRGAGTGQRPTTQTTAA